MYPPPQAAPTRNITPVLALEFVSAWRKHGYLRYALKIRASVPKLDEEGALGVRSGRVAMVAVTPDPAEMTQSNGSPDFLDAAKKHAARFAKIPKNEIARFRHLTLPKPCNLKYTSIEKSTLHPPLDGPGHRGEYAREPQGGTYPGNGSHECGNLGLALGIPC
jgi:hypothetical protein